MARVSRRNLLAVGLAAAASHAAPRYTWSQSYPARSVRIVVGFTAGGSTDIGARLIGQWLQERLGQPFVVENRPGAGTNIATDAVAHATPPTATRFSWSALRVRSTQRSTTNSISCSFATSRR